MLQKFKRKLLALAFAIMAFFSVASYILTPVYAETKSSSITELNLVNPVSTISGKEEIDDSDKETLKHMFGDEWESHTDLADTSFSITHPINTTEKTIAWNIIKVVDILTDIGADFFAIEEKDYVTLEKIGLKYFQPTFKNEILQGIFDLYKNVEWLMFAIGILLAVGEEVIAYGNGKGNFASLFVNIIKAFFFCIAFNFIAANFYNIASDLGQLISKQFILENAESATKVSTTVGLLGSFSAIWTFISTGGFLFILGYAIVIFVIWFKIAVFYAKKVPIMLTMMAKGSIMPFFMVRGNNSTVTQYLQSLGMFFLQIILQFAFVGLGISLMGSGGLSNVVIGLVILFSINEVDKWVGGIGGEDDIDKMVSFIHHSQIGKINNTIDGMFGNNSSSDGNQKSENIIPGAMY